MQFILKDILLKSFTLFLLITFPFVYKSFPQNDDKSLRTETIENIRSDDIRGEDLKIRQAAIEALGNRAGTVVVMSPQSGRIYTIVNQNWGIRRGFKPCSTIKLVSGIAGYNEKLIRGNGDLAKESFRLGLDDSLAYSNNSYFQKIGSDLGSGTMIAYSRRLGLGERTGINSSGEYAGKLPYGNENLRIYSHADDFEVTALQLAVMVSAITNGGDLVVPQIPRNDYSKASFRGYYKRNLDLKPTVFERVIPGMIGAVRYGTAKGIDGSNLKIAGKTGSCIADGTWVGLFTSVAPIVDPRFAVVVITEGKYARGSHAASVAGKIYRALGTRFNEKYKGTLARKTIVVGSKPQTVAASIKPENTVIIVPKAGEDRVAKTASVSKSAPKETSKASNQVSESIVIEVGHKKEPEMKKGPSKPVVVIGAKQEITRPRIVVN
ncbi:MAG: penicillin-binding transpeptidase domain-containing protein [Pyrinomonadaceae bacterium]